MNPIALPAFTDNYIWMLHDGRDALVVDPGDAAPVAEALERLSLRLAGILVTHHHPDHVGGLDRLRPRLHGAVWGPAREAIPAPFVPLRDGDTVELIGLHFEVIEVPGHTAGHIAYLQRAQDGAAPAAPLLFCGDTLFSAGCGRLFEGSPEQMHASLGRLGALGADVQVCCTHEYTLDNLRFAAAVEPDNRDREAYAEWCRRQRAAGRPTLPSTIARERAVNPFLRCDETAVIAAAMAHGALSRRGPDVFAALRSWKDHYR